MFLSKAILIAMPFYGATWRFVIMQASSSYLKLYLDLGFVEGKENKWEKISKHSPSFIALEIRDPKMIIIKMCNIRRAHKQVM